MKHSIFIDGHLTNETRVAVLDSDSNLIYYNIESEFQKTETGNIYIGIVRNVEPSLQAAFVHYGNKEKNGLLPLSKIHPKYFDVSVHEDIEDIKFENSGKLFVESTKKSYSIEDLVKVGTYIIVQTVKEKRQNKGPLLTTYLSVSGPRVSITPNPIYNNKSTNKHLMDAIDDSFGVGYKNFVSITNDKSFVTKKLIQQIIKEIKYTSRIWETIRSTIISNGINIGQVYEETDILRDTIYEYCTRKCESIYIEGEQAIEDTKRILDYTLPSKKKLIHPHSGDIPLFDTRNIEKQIACLKSFTIGLDSGGYIVISHTEALTTIDVNSGSYVQKEGSSDSTSLTVNLNAIPIICRHIIKSNIGGIIVIDLIDMDSKASRLKVEAIAKQLMRRDPSRSYVGKISSLGTLTIMRQRIGFSIYEKSYAPCDKCNGSGYYESLQSRASDTLRSIRKIDDTQAVIVEIVRDVYEHIFKHCTKDIQNIKSARQSGISFRIMRQINQENKKLDPKKNKFFQWKPLKCN